MSRFAAGAALATALAGAALAQDARAASSARPIATATRSGRDARTDPKLFVNPSTIIFAYTPVEDPAGLAKTWDGFLRHMEKLTGKKVVFFPVQSNAAQMRPCAPAACTWRLQYRLETRSRNCASFVPVAIMGSQNGSSLRDGRSSCRPTAPSNPADLKGQKLAFTRRRRIPASRRRTAHTQGDFNLEAERDLHARVLRKHDNSVCGRRQTRIMTRRRSQRGDEAHGRGARWSTRPDPLDLQVGTFRHGLRLPPTTSIRNSSKGQGSVLHLFPWEGSALKADVQEQDRSSRSPTRRLEPWIRKSTATGVIQFK